VEELSAQETLERRKEWSRQVIVRKPLDLHCFLGRPELGFSTDVRRLEPQRDEVHRLRLEEIVGYAYKTWLPNFDLRFLANLTNGAVGRVLAEVEVAAGR
jgi:hypothetical protein